MAYIIRERPVETIDAISIEPIAEEWLGYIPDRPISSDDFCGQSRPDDDLELIGGMVVQRAMVQWDHEQCQMWLATVLNGYVRSRELGVVAGSRTALEINQFQVRLPDLIFLRRDNPADVRQQGIRGIPDLLIEIVSPSDRRGDLLARETDYRTLGATEIVFIDQTRKRIRTLHKENASYTETTLRSGETWHPQAIANLTLNVDWILSEPRPSPLDVLNGIMNAPGTL